MFLKRVRNVSGATGAAGDLRGSGRTGISTTNPENRSSPLMGVHVYMYISTYIYIRMYIYMYLYTYICIYIHVLPHVVPPFCVLHETEIAANARKCYRQRRAVTTINKNPNY